jgi:hypothetical protein
MLGFFGGGCIQIYICMLVMLGFLATMDATNPPLHSSRSEGHVIAIIGAIAKYNHVIIDLHSNVQVLEHNRNRIALPLHHELNVIPCILTSTCMIINNSWENSLN